MDRSTKDPSEKSGNKCISSMTTILTEHYLQLQIFKKAAYVLLFSLCISRSVDCKSCKEVSDTKGCYRKGSVMLYPVTHPVERAEGPHWDSINQVLYFVDQAGSFNKYDPKTGKTTTTHLDQGPGVAVPIQNTSDSFLVGLGHDLAILKWDGSSHRSTYQVIDTVERNKPNNKFNDGKADKKGVFWIGTLNEISTSPDGLPMSVPDEASLYHYSIQKCKLVKDITVTFSNGIEWNKDYTLMYYIDSLTKKIVVFDYDLETSSISNPRPVFSFEDHNIPGIPDGVTIDTQDNLWVACFTGSRVIRIDPRSGKLLFTIYFQVEQVTSVTFGGPNLDVLYVTTSKLGLNETQLAQQPDAGSVFAVCGLKVKGRPANNAVVCYHANS